LKHQIAGKDQAISDLKEELEKSETALSECGRKADELGKHRHCSQQAHRTAITFQNVPIADGCGVCRVCPRHGGAELDVKYMAPPGMIQAPAATIPVASFLRPWM